MVGITGIVESEVVIVVVVVVVVVVGVVVLPVVLSKISLIPNSIFSSLCVCCLQRNYC